MGSSVFPGSFYQLHFYGAWVFVAALVVHVGIKFPALVASLRGRSLRREPRTGTAETTPEPREASDLVAPLHLLALLASLALTAYAAGTRVARRRARTRPVRVPWINHVRLPAVISAILLSVWFPLIFRLPPGFRGITGYTTGPYLERWLLVTGALFPLSAFGHAVRLRRAR